MKKLIIDTPVGSQKWNAFTQVFKDTCELKDFGSNKRFNRPLSESDFFSTIEDRISHIKNYWRVKESKEEVLFGSIQKGFVKSGSIWQITAIIALTTENKFCTHFTESIPVIGLTDEIMRKNGNDWINSVNQLYPNFQNLGLISLLLPGETEENWLAKAIATLKQNSNF